MHNIRQATIDDAETIDHIWRQRLAEDQPPNEESLLHFKKLLEEQDDVFKCWVLEEDGKIIGWAGSTPMRSMPSLRSTMTETPVYLSREVRGRGFSSRLLDHVLNQIVSTPVEWIIWFVGASNLVSKRLFQNASKRMLKKCCNKIGELPPVDKNPDRDVIEIWALPLGNIVKKESES